MRFIADHKASYIAQQLLWLVPALFGLIVFVALLIALLPASPSLAVLGFTVGGASWTALLAVPVTIEGTLSLVYLSDHYAAAADPPRGRPSRLLRRSSWRRTTRSRSPGCSPRWGSC